MYTPGSYINVVFYNGIKYYKIDIFFFRFEIVLGHYNANMVLVRKIILLRRVEFCHKNLQHVWELPYLAALYNVLFPDIPE